MRRSVPHIVLLGVLLGVGSGCSSEPSSEAPTTPSDEPAETAVSVPDSADYVGTEACASCHSEIAESYSETGHGQSLTSFDPATAPEQFGSGTIVDHEATNLSYEALTRNDSLYQREFRQGPSGKVVHEREHPAAHVVGSGNATRSYLMEVNGYLTEMPLTWYADRERWDMSPGYEDANDRFGRKINLQCMSCHSGRPERSSFTQNHSPEPPEAITCERCHGPGETHVYRQRTEEDSEATGLSIVTPTRSRGRRNCRSASSAISRAFRSSSPGRTR